MINHFNPVSVLVSKYDDLSREDIVEDWSGYEDIGKSFGGVVLVSEEYYRVENSYLNFVRQLANSLNVVEFNVRSILISGHPPEWVEPLHSGRVVGLEFALLLLKRMLRSGDFYCILSATELLSISVETDFYLSVEVPDDKVGVLDIAAESGLKWSHVPAQPDFSGERIVRLLDGEFWVEVEARADGNPVILLERWANGVGGEKWYLISPNRVSESFRRPLPCTAVAAMFDLNVDWWPRSQIFERIRELAGGDESVVIFSRPGGTDLLDSATLLEGVDSAAESGLPAGGELGWIVYPNFSDAEEGGVEALRAVSSAGAVWSSEMQLIW